MPKFTGPQECRAALDGQPRAAVPTWLSVAFIEPGRMRTNRVYLRHLTSKSTSYLRLRD